MAKTHLEKHGVSPRRFSGIIQLGVSLRRRLGLFHSNVPQGAQGHPSDLITPKQSAVQSARVEAERARAQALAQMRRYAGS